MAERIPETVVPRDALTAVWLTEVTEDWWRKLTPEQRVGLWSRFYVPPGDGGMDALRRAMRTTDGES